LDDDITRKLADFQKVAVRQAVQITRDFGGSFVADVVGLGKSYIGAAIGSTSSAPTTPVPSSFARAVGRDVGAIQRCVPTECSGAVNWLSVRGRQWQREHLLQDAKYRDRDFVLWMRATTSDIPTPSGTRFFKHFSQRAVAKACFLTANPRNKSAWDVYFQSSSSIRTTRPIFPSIR